MSGIEYKYKLEMIKAVRRGVKSIEEKGAGNGTGDVETERRL